MFTSGCHSSGKKPTATQWPSEGGARRPRRLSGLVVDKLGRWHLIKQNTKGKPRQGRRAVTGRQSLHSDTHCDVFNCFYDTITKAGPI